MELKVSPMRVILSLSLFGLLFYVVACTSVEHRDKSNDAKYHYLMGVSALNENNPADALREFMLAEQFDQRDPEIQAGLAEAYLRKEAFQKAEQHYIEALKLSDYEPKYYNNLGVLYLNMQRFDDAIANFRLAADNLLFDRPEVSWTGIGFAEFQKQNYPAAERAYKEAVDLNNRYYQAHFRLGELYYVQGRPVEAIDRFSRSVELVPNFAEGYYWLGLTYMKIEELSKAKLAFQDVVRLSPQSERARIAQKYLAILN